MQASCLVVCLGTVFGLLSPLRVFGARADAPTPPMGWNSFNSYGVYLHEEAALTNLEAMAAKLAPYGYEYFVIDNGWFGEYRLQPGTRFAREKHAADVHLDAHGYPQPSQVYFPRGFAPLIERCHALGLKFGVHLMRGIPRKACELDLPIEGTSFTAREIVDTDPAHQCQWCEYNYAVDVTKPGAQAWYDGLIRHLSDQGVDFVKYDDIVPYPHEVEAVAAAIRKLDRPIVLSLSPGDRVDPSAIDAFRQANLLRVTRDIWDDQADIDQCFGAWRRWSGAARPGFWIDMDMISFGELQIMKPPPLHRPAKAQEASAGDVALAGRGFHRWCRLSPSQMQTFITLRALSASPLIFGGDLVSLDAFSLRLITESEMIACNQNGVMGRLMHEADDFEVWQAPEKANGKNGWLGVFNRRPQTRDASLSLDFLGLNSGQNYSLTDVWNGGRLIDLRGQQSRPVTVADHGVLFLRYEQLAR